jgi:hypothetical protein
MPVRDLKNNVALDLNLYHEFTSSSTHTGAVLDTADYDSGIMFGFALPAWADGTYTPSFDESDTGTSGWTAIPAEQLIGTIADVTLDAQTAEGDVMPTIGILSTKRYIRANVVASGVTSGATSLAVVAKMPELKPVA